MKKLFWTFGLLSAGVLAIGIYQSSAKKPSPLLAASGLVGMGAVDRLATKLRVLSLGKAAATLLTVALVQGACRKANRSLLSQ